MVQAGILTSENGVSKINLNDGTFSFYNGSLKIDETYFDEKAQLIELEYTHKAPLE